MRPARREVQWTVAQALRTPQFITLALAHFACCAAHSGPIFHMVSYAMICGIAPLTAVTVYSVAGFSGLGGRLLLGVLADRLGAKPVLVGGLLVQALCDRDLSGGRPARRVLCARRWSSASPMAA